VKAVFLDRDGVICRNLDRHVKSWDDFHFLPLAREAVARLTEAGLTVVVVTNQAIINRGIVSAAVVDDIHRGMIAAVAAHGGRIARVYCCPHRPDEQCGCRKPQPGLLRQAISDLGIVPEDSYLVGDALTDILAAQAVGLKPYLVLSGRGRHQYLESLRREIDGFCLALNLWEAVADILRKEVARHTGE
jgi:histidinol-phosphate phosphatase family protein